MSETRWDRLSRLLEEALERPPADRRAFLDEACAGRPDDRVELESLIAAHERGGAFLDEGAGPVAAALVGDPPELEPGATIGRFRIVRKLGQGGMGVVYLAEDSSLWRPVALKRLTGPGARDRSLRERLRREARAAAALSHPNIAAVYSLEESGDDLFIVSEYVDGPTLRQVMTETSFTASRLLDVAVQIARALQAAHARAIVHRDLKPENIVCASDGRLRVLDFGIARIGAATDGADAITITRTGMVVGTPGYMAPEQIRGEPVDFRADIFAFGVILYELAAGAHPFAGSTAGAVMANILTAPHVPLADRGWAMPALDRVIELCLQKDPAARFATTNDLVSTLEEIRAAHRTGTTPTLEPLAGAPKTEGRAAVWWRVHQIATSAAYGLLIWPLWVARDVIGPPLGTGLLLSASIAAVVAASLRLHLAFTAWVHPEDVGSERAQAATPVRIADWAFAAVLLVSGALVAGEHTALSVLLVSAAVAITIVFLRVEPATARAAFPGERPGTSGGQTR